VLLVFRNEHTPALVYFSVTPPPLRRVLQLSTGLFILYILAATLCGIFLAEITLRLPRRHLAHQAEAAEIVRQQFHTDLRQVGISASDGTELKAWYISPPKSSGDAVILLHGVTDNREGVAGFAPMFLNAGYAVLIPDSRAHGESGGEIATYGIRERYDTKQWNEWLKQQSHGCVYLFGESMGAAIALQATEVTPGLCAVAVESPFSTFREIAFDRMAQHSPFGTWFWRSAGRPVIEIALAYGRLRYDVNLTDASPEQAMEHSRVPALLVAGTADHNIPMRHSAELVKAAGSHTELWVVEGADHGGAVAVAHDEFQRRILSWFRDHHELGL
jgi:alpha-beta hydrolase superfamily lysophospholipase